MAKAEEIFVERRRYIRLDTPINFSYSLPDSDTIHRSVTKNISADGLRFEAREKDLKESDVVELRLDIPGAVNPVHAKGRIMWKKKLTLEDGAPHNFGAEIIEVEEDNKNTFLKFFCDFIYDISKEPKYATTKY